MKALDVGLAVATIAVAVASSLTLAHVASVGEEKVAPLMRQSLVDVPGREVVLATVSYAPGQASLPHRHAGSVFAYVLEGSIVSQLEGEAPRTYTAGQSWYEPPRAPHLVSRNASATRPARLLAVLLVDEGGAVKETLEGGVR